MALLLHTLLFIYYNKQRCKEHLPLFSLHTTFLALSANSLCLLIMKFAPTVLFYLLRAQMHVAGQVFHRCYYVCLNSAGMLYRPTLSALHSTQVALQIFLRIIFVLCAVVFKLL